MLDGGGFDPNEQKIPSEGDEHKPVRTEDSLVPVTIRQIIQSIEQSKSDPPLIDNTPRKHISIVGMITEVTEDNISIIYTVDDGTGQFRVQDYTHAESDNNLSMPFGVNSYVYVVGRFKAESPDNSSPPFISAYAVKPVTDPNQIAFHNLHALFVHLFAQRGRLPPHSAFEREASHHNNSNTSNYNSDYNGSSNQNNNDSKMSDDEILKEAVKSFIRSKDQSYGVHINEIRRALSSRFSGEDIDRIVENLSYTGEIYSASEQDTYALC
ncbi:Replication factor A protein 2 [Tritrichomonas musculus]|uniref:Replication factor A protein 2 n=1 Tax=Tritrichomonas musculus TaxID=1915356 RepID=A0ABR2KKH8_9EUKA